MGHKFYASLEKYGGKIDMSVIALPTRAVKQAVEDSLPAGAQAVVVITSGFKEVSEEGAALASWDPTAWVS